MGTRRSGCESVSGDTGQYSNALGQRTSNGVPSMQKLSYEWQEESPSQEYITRKEFEDVINRLTKKEEVENE